MDQFVQQAVRVFDKVSVTTRGSLRGALDSLRELGWSIEDTVYPYSSCYDNVWTHPAIAELNAGHKTDYARDMLHHFFDLYRLSDGVEPEYFAPCYLSVGRIGNSTDFLLTPPAEYREDRADVRDQMLLF